MTKIQVPLIRQREIWLERILVGLFIVPQIGFTTLIYLHDSQGGFIPLAIMTTFVKSVLVGAVLIELLRLASRLLKKHWVYTAMKGDRDRELKHTDRAVLKF